MSSSEWWANLLQGSLGSFLSLVGLFGVFWLTRRHEIRRDQLARTAEREREAAQRTALSVTRIVKAALDIRVRLDDGTSLEQMSHELMLFSVSEIADHPTAARWASEQSSILLELRGDDVDIRAAPWQAASITGGLQAWMSKNCPDGLLVPTGKSRPKKNPPWLNLPEGEPLTRA